MSNVPCILIVPQTHAVDMTAVFAAQGRGPATFTEGRALVAVGTTSPIVARLAQDMNADVELEAAWRAMASRNDLPAITGVWGENGVISAADAQAAMSGLSVHSVAGVIPSDWTDSVLAGHNYEFEPQPEI